MLVLQNRLNLAHPFSRARNRKPMYKCFQNGVRVQNLLVFDTTPPLDAPLLVSGKALIAQLELSAPPRVAVQFQEKALYNVQ